MPTSKVLSANLVAQLELVPKSHDRSLEYAPCLVRLRSGEVLPRVYIVEASAFSALWGDDPKRNFLDVAEIASIEDSPFRLPRDLADVVYEAGESGMGYCIFTVQLRDGRTLPFVTGNAADFTDWPPDVDPRDAVAVEPHVGRDNVGGANSGSAPFVWGLFEEPVVAH
jgi:hypothetical protein